jgi:hypothetical protein
MFWRYTLAASTCLPTPAVRGRGATSWERDKNWECCATDSDGSVLLIAEETGRIYLSTNGGGSWSEATTSRFRGTNRGDAVLRTPMAQCY